MRLLLTAVLLLFSATVSHAQCVASSPLATARDSSLTVGDTAQASARATLRGTSELRCAVQWSTTDATKATVSASGLIRAVGAGKVSIRATVGSVNDVIPLVIVAAPTPPPAPAPLPPPAPVPPAPPVGTTEPVYSAASHALLVRDDFEGYADVSAAIRRYNVGRNHEYVSLTTGRGGGKAVRLSYGIGAAEDILFGTETKLDRVGGWNGTLPEKAGPYTHFSFTAWFRTSAGANPTQNNSSGIKGFMFWTSSGRYQNAVNQLSADGQTRGPKGANPNNAESGMTLYKTADGRAPLWSTYSDGNWHRFTIEIYAGNDPSGHRGERYWVDGTLIYSDIDLRVGSGTKADHYDYTLPVTHWFVWGNFVSASARSAPFAFEVDDWTAWTDK